MSGGQIAREEPHGRGIDGGEELGEGEPAVRLTPAGQAAEEQVTSVDGSLASWLQAEMGTDVGETAGREAQAAPVDLMARTGPIEAGEPAVDGFDGCALPPGC